MSKMELAARVSENSEVTESLFFWGQLGVPFMYGVLTLSPTEKWGLLDSPRKRHPWAVTWQSLDPHSRYQFFGQVRVKWLSFDHLLGSLDHWKRPPPSPWGWWSQSLDTHEQSCDSHLTVLLNFAIIGTTTFIQGYHWWYKGLVHCVGRNLEWKIVNTLVCRLKVGEKVQIFHYTTPPA